MTQDSDEYGRFLEYFASMGASYVDVTLGLVLATRHPEWAWFWTKQMERGADQEAELADLIVAELPVAVEA